jgi:hypothetical protein
MNDGRLCACSVVYSDFRCYRVRVQLFIMIFGGIEVVFCSLLRLSVEFRSSCVA